MKTPPCYKCEMRCYGCHAKCVDYAAWAAERETERARERSPCTDGHIQTQKNYLRRVLRNRSGSHHGGNE